MKADSVQHNRKRLARGSVRLMFSTISGILSEAVEDNLIKSNPVAGLWRKVTKGKAAKDDKVRALDTEPREDQTSDAAVFLTTAREVEPRHYPYFAMLMLAGLRPGEGFGVTADRINSGKRSLLVDRQVTQHGRVKVKPPKGNKERSADLSAVLVDILRAAAASKTSTAKVVSISGETVREEEPTSGPWLFYPELS